MFRVLWCRLFGHKMIWVNSDTGMMQCRVCLRCGRYDRWKMKQRVEAEAPPKR